MNDKLKTEIMALLVILSLTSAIVNAQNSKNSLPVATIDYKCHVELIGGIETINFINVKKQSLNEIARSIIGKKTFKPFSREKIAIVKVFECVKLHDKFTRLQSNAVDKKTIR